MKDVIKTAVSVLVVLVIGVVIFFIVGNVEYGVQLLTKTELPLTDPDVSILYNRVKENGHLRRALLNGNELGSTDIIKYTLDNLKKSDYKKVKIDKEKISCSVNDKIIFYTDSKQCNIIEISNDLFYEYQSNDFNVSNELEFKDIKYHGYNCKNNGKKYYCLVGSYTDTLLGYSEFVDAYKTRDTIVIHEYYLRVDLNDKEYCKQYLDEAYCKDYKGKEKPSIDKDVIVDNGVLYEHVFIKKRDSYYLQKSFIVSEG